MRIVNIAEEDERKAFALEAAAEFAANKGMWSYTRGPIERDKWFALRFGGGDDCVVVFKTHEYMEIVVYENIVERS